MSRHLRLPAPPLPEQPEVLAAPSLPAISTRDWGSALYLKQTLVTLHATALSARVILVRTTVGTRGLLVLIWCCGSRLNPVGQLEVARGGKDTQ